MPWYRPVKPRLNGNGYIKCWMPKHPNAEKTGNIYMHIFVASQALGRPLPKGSEVHHVNEDGTDNRPENLVICENGAYHKLLHLRAKALKACGDPTARQCQFCKKWEPVGMTTMYCVKKQAYHKSCRNAHLKTKRDGGLRDERPPRRKLISASSSAETGGVSDVPA